MKLHEMNELHHLEHLESASEMLSLPEFGAAREPELEPSSAPEILYLDLETVVPTIKAIVWETASEPVVIANQPTARPDRQLEQLALRNDIVELERSIG